MTLQTLRLTLIPATVALVRMEINDHAALAGALHAAVPTDWPPETVADALPFFLSQLTTQPDLTGWLSWYVLTHNRPTLIASIGFFGPPEKGDVEIGYSVLPPFQRQGYATEMVNALAEWALSQPGVQRVLAQTAPDNLASRRVLEKCGFVSAGAGREPGHLRFARPAL